LRNPLSDTLSSISCLSSFARLSRGMKRALTIAAALAHGPALVFLDEPTTGLYVMGARWRVEQSEEEEMT